MQLLCDDLSIEEFATAFDKELVESGYHSQETIPELPNIDLPFEDLLPAGLVPMSQRKPHLLYNTFLNRISRKKATSFAQDLFS